MRALIQRVDSASVRLPGGEERAIGAGLLIYLGVGLNDTDVPAKRLAEKIIHLRIFSNAAGKFDHSLLDQRGSALVISQFTLYADPRGGRRPDFTGAAAPAPARELYASFARFLAAPGLEVKTGEFAAHMEVSSINNGPVTIWLDTDVF